MLRVHRPLDETLVGLLGQHPNVELVEPEVASPSGLDLTFDQGAWRRRLVVGEPAVEIFGLVEEMDNNPLVCADVASLPGPAATLAALALAPVARSGLVLEPPVLLYARQLPDTDLEATVARLGIAGEPVVQVEERDLGPVGALVAMVVVPTPEDFEEFGDLYDEVYGRSFYVRRARPDEWDTRLVHGTPLAAYRLEATPDEGRSLLSVHVMADVRGKLGATQVVHALNVMAGFEESLGVPQQL